MDDKAETQKCYRCYLGHICSKRSTNTGLLDPKGHVLTHWINPYSFISCITLASSLEC